MKKFYTLISLALLSSGLASASLQDSLKEKINATKTASATMTETVSTSVKAENLNERTTAARKVAAKAEGTEVSVEDIEGIYSIECVEVSNGKLTLTSRAPLTITQKEGNLVELDGLYYSDIICEGELDPLTGTITVPTGQDVAVDGGDGTQLHITPYVYNFDTGSAEPLVLNVDIETRTVSYEAGVDADSYYTDCFLLGTVGAAPGSRIYCQVYAIDGNKANSIMSYLIPASEEGADPDSYTDLIWAQMVGDDLELSGMANAIVSTWKFPALATINMTEATATLTDQVAFESKNDYGVKTSYFYMTVTEANGLVPEVTFNIAVDKSEGYPVSTLSTQHMAIATKAGKGLIVYNPTIQVFDIDLLTPAGVEGVVADADLNAPVEYFNLQGVRVANPEAGQLVIKRQGSTVTKLIVR